MAEHPNAELMRKGYDAFGKGDMDALAAIIAADAVWHVPGSNPTSGTYKGRDEIFGYFGKLVELSGGTIKVELHDALGNDVHAIGMSKDTASRGAKSLNVDEVLIAHIRDGQLAEAWEAYPDQAAVDTFWS